MLYVAIILTFLCGFLAAASLALLSISFSKGQRKKYPLLTKLDGKQLHLASLFLVLSMAAYGANIWKEFLNVKLSFELSQGPRGELAQKATSSNVRREIEETVHERSSTAEDFFNAAERDFKAERFREAATNYQKSLDAMPTLSAYLNLGISLRYLADYKQSEAALTLGLRLARERGKKEFQAYFLNNLTSVNYLQNFNAEEALKSYQEALEIFKQIGSLAGQANVLNNIGLIYSVQGNKEEAEKSLSTSLEYYKQLNSLLGQARIQNNLSTHYWLRGQYEDSLRAAQSALKIYEQLGNLWGQATANGNIGVVYLRQGKFDEALTYTRKAIELYEQTGDRFSLANQLINLGGVYREKNELDDSVKTYKTALEISQQINSIMGAAGALSNIGQMYEEQGKLDDALKSYQSALELIKGKFPAFEGNILVNIGSIYSKQRKYEDALRTLEQARKMASDIHDPSAEGDAINSVGEMYMNKGEKQKALEFLRQAREIYQGAGLSGRTTESNQAMIQQLESSLADKK